MTPPPTLTDLAAAPGELIASCQNCHHNATLPVDPVLARYGPTTPFPEVKARFRCSACGSRQVDVRPNWSRHSPGQITRHTD
jgi:Zn finger protein HypA/HybF involved in hydrogenase expression